MSESNMIKGILGVIDGSLTIASQNSGSVYLSDGSHWNKAKFHRNRSLIASLIQVEVNASDEVKAVQRMLSNVIEEKKREMVLRVEASNRELDFRLGGKSEGYVMFEYSTNRMGFGKYKGMRVCDVWNLDRGYFKWLFNHGCRFDFGGSSAESEM